MVSAAFYSAMAGFFLGSRLGVLSLAVATALDGVTAATLFGMSFPTGLQAGVVAAIAFQLAAFSAMTLRAGPPGPLHRSLRATRATIRTAFGPRASRPPLDRLPAFALRRSDRPIRRS